MIQIFVSFSFFNIACSVRLQNFRSFYRDIKRSKNGTNLKQRRRHPFHYFLVSFRARLQRRGA